MNPHKPHPSSPSTLVSSILTYRELIYKLARMDVSSRYKGSFLGLWWTFFNPILMLSVYTFVFSFVFNARWGGTTTGSRSEFDFDKNTLADGTQNEHAQHHWLHDAINFKSHSSSVSSGLVGVPMQSIQLEIQ